MSRGIVKAATGPQVEAEVDSNLGKLFASAGKALRPRMRTAMIAAQMLVANTAKAKYLSGPRPDKLGVVTGRLRGSIATPRPTMDVKGNIEGKVGTSVVYAAIHEYGGTIVPKNASYLAVPFTGVKGSPRDYNNTFVKRSQSNTTNLVVFQDQGGGNTRPIFTLTPQVTIPPRPFLHPALNDNRAVIRKLFLKAMQDTMTRAKSGI